MDGAFNLSQLAKHFSDEDAARELLEDMRWGKDGAVCPHCGGADPYKLTPKPGSSTRKGVWKCRACRKQFTVKVSDSERAKLLVTKAEGKRLTYKQPA